MGLELHVTRNGHWADDERPISLAEWLEFVEKDPELELNPDNGKGFAEWLGKSAYDEPWLDWCGGNISTKWPDTALYKKMLGVAAALGANVQDDDGTRYPDEAQWEYTPPS